MANAVTFLPRFADGSQSISTMVSRLLLYLDYPYRCECYNNYNQQISYLWPLKEVVIGFLNNDPAKFYTARL